MLLDANQVEMLLITNDKGAKAQVGYDLTVKAIKKIKGGAVMKNKTILEEYVEVQPKVTMEGAYIYSLDVGTYSLTFEQGCKLDNNHTAFIRHRSSILRCGGIITSGVYDPAFCVDEMGAVLIVNEPMIIEKGARVAQIIIFENHEAEAYDGQWAGAKDYK